jgi:hypothetical protein
MLAWAAVSACTAAVHNYPTLVVVRTCATPLLRASAMANHAGILLGLTEVRSAFILFFPVMANTDGPGSILPWSVSLH